MEQFTAALLDLSAQWTGHAWLLRNFLMAALLARLVYLRLYRRYPVLTGYLLVSILRSAMLSMVPIRTKLYGDLFYATEPLIWLSYAAVSWEIYGLVFEKYRGLSILTRRTLVIVLGVAFTISVLAASRYMNHAFDLSPLMRRAGLSSRAVVSTFFLFLITLLGFMLWFRMVVSRNVVLYAVAFSLLFVGVGMGAFLFGANQPSASPAASFLMIAFIDLVLAGWGLMLLRSGEEVPSRLGPRPSPVQERQLLETLNSLNELAAAVSKRD